MAQSVEDTTDCGEEFKRKKIRIDMQFVTRSKGKQQKLLLSQWSFDKDVEDVQFNLFMFDVNRQKQI